MKKKTLNLEFETQGKYSLIAKNLKHKKVPKNQAEASMPEESSYKMAVCFFFELHACFKTLIRIFCEISEEISRNELQ